MLRRHFALAGAALAVSLLASPPARAATLQVGPGKTYATPCAAIAAASAGDVVEVDAAGSYDGDTCAWTTDGLTVRGVNGRAKIDLTGVTPAQQKGIFVIGGGASATIESFELSGAAISASAGNNGAGIRHQGLNLTVRDCFIHDNQDGILGAPATPNTGTIVVENTELSHNGAGDGYSHNLYIGDFATFTLRFSYSHLASVGHLVKSRAYVTNVLYNRLTDETGGTASYEVDLPNGGTALVIGNVIEQSAASQNPTIVTFGEEGTPAGYDTHLFVVNNTIVNDLGSGTFVADATSTPAVVTNDILTGGGTPSSQAGAVLTTNFTGDPKFVNAATYDLELSAGSPCIDHGTAPGTGGGQSLEPVFEYVHPLSEVARSVVGPAIDIGAYEYGLATDAGVVGADAAVPDAAGGGATDAGQDGGGGGGGGGSSGGDGGAVVDGGAGSSGGGGGCSCRLGDDAGGGHPEALAALALVGAVLVRRGRRARVPRRLPLGRRTATDRA